MAEDPAPLRMIACDTAPELLSSAFQTWFFDEPGEILYFRFTGLGAGVDIETCGPGTSVDTDLFIYTGCEDPVLLYVRDGSPLCTSSDYPAYLRCEEFHFSLGVEYILAFSEHDSWTGPFVFQVDEGCPAPPRPANDLRENALPVQADGPCVTGSTLEAGNDALPPWTATNCWNGPRHLEHTGSGPDVWYTFTADGSSTYLFDLCGSGYDTALGLYSASGELLSGNDDGCGFTSRFTCRPPAGQHLLAVDGHAGDGGPFTLCVSTVTAYCGAAPDPVDWPLVEEEPPCADLNGGCNSSPVHYEFLPLGAGLVGTTWAANGLRDTDWFLIEVPRDGRVVLSLDKPCLPLSARLYPLACPAGSPLLNLSVAAGGSGSATSACLPAGSYFVVALPATAGDGLFSGYPCNTNDPFRYGLRVDMESCAPGCTTIAPVFVDPFAGVHLPNQQFADGADVLGVNGRQRTYLFQAAEPFRLLARTCLPGTTADTDLVLYEGDVCGNGIERMFRTGTDVCDTDAADLDSGCLPPGEYTLLVMPHVQAHAGTFELELEAEVCPCPADPGPLQEAEPNHLCAQALVIQPGVPVAGSLDLRAIGDFRADDTDIWQVVLEEPAVIEALLEPAGMEAQLLVYRANCQILEAVAGGGGHCRPGTVMQPLGAGTWNLKVQGSRQRLPVHPPYRLSVETHPILDPCAHIVDATLPLANLALDTRQFSSVSGTPGGDRLVRFVAPCTGPLVADLCGSAAYTTGLEVWENSSPCSGGSPLATNDFGGCPGFPWQSSLAFPVVAGRSYTLVAEAAYGWGNLELTVSGPCVPCPLVNDLAIAHDDGVLQLSWSPLPGALSYTVYGADSPGGAEVALATVSQPGYTLPLVGPVGIFSVRALCP